MRAIGCPRACRRTRSPTAAALCERLGGLLGIEIETSELNQAAEAYEEQVSQAVAADEETASYVEELERRVDELAAEENIPSGEALAAELTRFLRERENGTDGTGGDVARDQ